VRDAILSVVPTSGEGLPFRELPGRVAQALDDDVRAKLGSVSWYTTTVKLDLEVDGRLRRVAGRGPQRLVRVGGPMPPEEP